MSILLTEHDVSELLSYDDAIADVELGFRLLAEGDAVNAPRQRAETDGAVLNVMWAIAPTLSAMGVKSYPVVRSDVTQSATSTFVLYELPTGAVAGILEADVLGQRRTGAASAVATRALAREGAEVLTVFGSGWQAQSQVEAIARVVPGLARVHVLGRSTSRAQAFAARLVERLGIAADADAPPERAVGEADIVVTATGASEPVFDGSWLRPGAHVNAIGSNYAEKRELDAEALARADLIVADALDVAEAECGDVIRNSVDWQRVGALGDVLSGSRPGRVGQGDITIFESQGLAIQDVVCARRVVRLARERGVGSPLALGS